MLLWSCELEEENNKQILSGGSNYDSFLVIFAGIALKLEKVNPSFAIDRKQFQHLNIVLNNKTGPLFLEFTEAPNDCFL